MTPRKKKFFKIAGIAAIAVAAAIVLLNLAAGPKARQIDYGVTFSAPYARALGLDWKQVYSAMFTDLGVKKVRISAYWDDTQPEKDRYAFEDLDFQVNEAAKHNAQVILGVGMRLPRWPECHEPNWYRDLPSQSDKENALLSYIETVVSRYQGNPAVEMWQVENEAFLASFGPCPKLNIDLFDRELALVKRLDPSKPVLITDSGELSSWLYAGKRGDVFGSTYYRYVYSDVLHRYWTNFYFPGWFYRAKAGYVRLLNHGKPVMIAELEAEPWTTGGITNTPIEEQMKTMSMGKFKTITRLARKTGFSPQYLWGVEWWYWMKQQGHPEFLEAAAELIKNR